MFQRFTENARRAIFFARYEASQSGVPYIDTEHLLLGLMREDRPLTQMLLPGRPEEEIRAAVEKRGGPREAIPSSADLPLSSESKRVLSYAVEESDAFSHPYVGTEHLLLGLLRQEKTQAGEFLLQHGLKLPTARRAVAALARQNPRRQNTESFPLRESPEALEDFGIDLTEQAARSGLTPLIGRERELEQLMRVLCCRGRRNAVLIGEPGVGRRAIVRGLATRIADGAVPDDFAGKTIITLDLMRIVSGVESRRLFEENLQYILGGLQARGGSMVFLVEDLHALATSSPVCLMVANVLKAAVLDRRIRCISTATREGYRKAIAQERWLQELFQTVEVEPLDQAGTLEVLKGIQGHYETFHGVAYTDEALRYAVFHSHNYILNRSLPEKAIDLMDAAGAHVKIRPQPAPPEITEARARIQQIVRRHEAALIGNEFEKARFFSEEEKTAREELRDLLKTHGMAETETPAVTRNDIDEVVSEWTGIPLEAVRASRMPE